MLILHLALFSALLSRWCRGREWVKKYECWRKFDQPQVVPFPSWHPAIMWNEQSSHARRGLPESETTFKHWCYPTFLATISLRKCYCYAAPERDLSRKKVKINRRGVTEIWRRPAGPEGWGGRLIDVVLRQCDVLLGLIIHFREREDNHDRWLLLHFRGTRAVLALFILS